MSVIEVTMLECDDCGRREALPRLGDDITLPGWDITFEDDVTYGKVRRDHCKDCHYRLAGLPLKAS